MAFDLDQFIADCRAAVAEGDRPKALREVVARAVADPQAVLATLGDPSSSTVQRLYHAPNLTILNVMWGPRMTLMPHNHRMAAVIGLYTGREDNIFWRRIDFARGRGRGWDQYPCTFPMRGGFTGAATP